MIEILRESDTDDRVKLGTLIAEQVLPGVLVSLLLLYYLHGEAEEGTGR